MVFLISVEHQVYHVQAPECNRVQFTVSNFMLSEKIDNSVGNPICSSEYLVLRTDLSTTEHQMWVDHHIIINYLHTVMYEYDDE